MTPAATFAARAAAGWFLGRLISTEQVSAEARVWALRRLIPVEDYGAPVPAFAARKARQLIECPRCSGAQGALWLSRPWRSPVVALAAAATAWIAAWAVDQIEARHG